MSACQTGLQRHPSYLSARVTLGRALQELGENAAASKEFEYVLSIAPDNLLAIRGLAELREASSGTGPAVQQARIEPARPKERPISEPFALKPPVADHVEADPEFVEAHVIESETEESQLLEPRFGELQFAEPQFNDADFAEAQLVESLIVEPQFGERSGGDESFRSWFDREDPDLDSGDVARSESIDAAIDAAIKSANESVREPSKPVDRSVYGPPEPPIAPMIEAVIDRASRAQRAAQIERLEIWLQRLEELRRDISGQHDA